ncbi:hypothetical protein D3C73_1266760 [compost metagenome]
MICKNIHRFGSGSQCRFAHGQILINFTGIITDGKRIDHLRIEANIEAFDVRSKRFGLFRSQKKHIT